MPIGTPPIRVNGSKLPAQLSASLRLGIGMLGSYAVGAGWVKPENVDGIATLILTLATVAYGIWRTGHKQSQLITAAEAAPDRVAKVV